MKRCNIRNLFVVILLGFTLLPVNAIAQQKSLKEQLVGAWTLVSMEVTSKDGTKSQDYGPNPKGVLILDSSGKYAQVQGRPDRPKFKESKSIRLDTPAAEFGEAARAFGANFGTWSINEADKTLIRQLEGALVPNVEGQETKSSVSLAGDELKLSGTSSGGAKTDYVYKR